MTRVSSAAIDIGAREDVERRAASHRAGYRAVSQPHIMSPAARKRVRCRAVRTCRVPAVIHAKPGPVRDRSLPRGDSELRRALARCRRARHCVACGHSALSAAQTAAGKRTATRTSLPHLTSRLPIPAAPPSAKPRRSPTAPRETGPIVLVLPLASDSFRRAAEAVRAGFLAAAAAANATTLVIAHGDNDVDDGVRQGEGRRARHRRPAGARRREDASRCWARLPLDDRAEPGRRGHAASAQHLHADARRSKARRGSSRDSRATQARATSR